MSEEKDFKELFVRNIVEETSPRFTADTMRQIEQLSMHEEKVALHSNNKAVRVFAISFLFVLLCIMVAAFFTAPIELPWDLNVLSQKISLHTFYNLILLISVIWAFVLYNHFFRREQLYK